ncbi:chaplin family protein [Salinactinospora qingdaonensis]|uniref:Chaplin domain-containing protein n=1 Tax=Salinactinospora qingdaonensis TaxID=702744 RepID=A0ABP7G6P4_9ACTN
MLKKTFATGAIVAAAASGVLMTGAPAFAAGDTLTSGNGSILGGNQIGADANIPVNACGNAVSVIGVAGAFCHDTAALTVEKNHGHY